ncbi:MAG TPA: hypothetical protein VGI39_13495 [Polyangiaceae bacterium]|jgi:hypothetical protein
MGVSVKEARPLSFELLACGCYVCGRDALWEIAVSGEDECLQGEFACEFHARGHLHVAIVLPEHTSDRSPYVAIRS